MGDGRKFQHQSSSDKALCAQAIDLGTVRDLASHKVYKSDHALLSQTS